MVVCDPRKHELIQEAVDDVEKQRQGVIAGEFSDRRMERIVQTLSQFLVTSRCVDDAPDANDSPLGDPARGGLGRQRFDQSPDFHELTNGRSRVPQIDGHGVGDSRSFRGRDDQTPPWTTSHLCDLVLLHDANRLAEESTSHSISLQELFFETPVLTHWPARSNDVLLDPVGELGRPLLRTLGGICRLRRYRGAATYQPIVAFEGSALRAE